MIDFEASGRAGRAATAAPDPEQIRGMVEARGPDRISGWAFAPGWPPLNLEFRLDGEVLGECLAAAPRPDLEQKGLAEGPVGFSWAIPRREEPIDPAAIEVREAASGRLLADRRGLKPRRHSRMKGFVGLRGPDEITGWAWSPDGPVRLAFMLGRNKLGECVADLPRPELRQSGLRDTEVGFRWEIPRSERPIDPGAIRVVEQGASATVPDMEGLHAAPARRLWGYVETRGPEVIKGWAWIHSGKARLSFVADGEVIGQAIADRRRPELKELGFGSGRVGFEWRLPYTDPPLDPAKIEVRADAVGETVPDAAGVRAEALPALRGMVEVRSAKGIAGWVTRPGGPVGLEFFLGGKKLGKGRADLFRAAVKQAGLGDGRAGFEWDIPKSDPPIDWNAVEVREAGTGIVIPDAEGMAREPGPARGMVDLRGPEHIGGWAYRWDGPVLLTLRRRGEAIGQVRADLLREALAGQPGFGDGRVGFLWRLPLTDPAFDPAEVEVVTETGQVLADAGGVTPVTPAPVRGVVEERGPDFVSGWARGANGPVTLELVLDGERLGTCLADGFRPDLAATGVGDGRAAFRWRLPFADPPVDVARLVVRDAASGALIADGPGLQPVQPKAVRGRVEVRGPEYISGWARGADGPVVLRMMLGDEVLAAVTADSFREGLRQEGVGDGRAAFEWRLPFTHPPIDPAKVRVVDAVLGIEVPDAPGLTAAQPEPVRGMVEECSYRLIAGWAWNGRPGARLKVEIVQDGKVIGTCVADKLRRDLAKSGMDDGRHGFSWTPPRQLKDFDAGKAMVRTGRHALPQSQRPPRDTGLQVADARIEAGWLMARLQRTAAAEPPAALDLVSNGAFLLRTEIGELDWRDGSADLEVELPRSLFDGRPRRLTLHEPREGLLLGGQDEPLALRSAYNSMVELLTGQEIRGWIIDPDDPDGRGEVELRDGGRLIRVAGFGRDRPEVAKAMGAAHAWEFSMRRLPAELFDGRPHELSLSCGGRPVFPHKRRSLSVTWTEADAPEGSERFEGAVQEISPLVLKGYVLDHLSDRPVELEVAVDGEVIARPMADRYLSALKDHAGHGFHGFECELPSALMNGRRRVIEVRPAGFDYALPPGRKPISFPLVAVAEAPPALDPPPLDKAMMRSQAEPALLSLIVLNLDGAHVLEPFLRSIAETGFRDELEVIVVDHGSSDESRQIIEDYRLRLNLTPVYRGANYSFSASCNLGAALARGRHLVFVNNDIVFTGDVLAGMRDILDTHDEVGLVGLRLLEPRYRGEERWERATHHTGVRFRVLVSQDKALPRLYHPVEVEDGGEEGVVIEPAATAALAMMRKSDFRAIQGFDEAYHYGYEDVDLALRLRGRLGKVAVCRLDATAVHNRSATREAKLVKSASGAAPGQSKRAAHTNLDIFTRRFSRHLPRLILRQLIGRGEAWRSAPLRVGLVVGEDGGREDRAARVLAAELRKLGWEPMLLREESGDLAQTDVLVSLRPGYELRRLSNAAPGLVTVAWRLSGPAAWEERDGLYQLRLDPPKGAAEGAELLRAAVLELMSGPRRRIAIKAQAENEPHATALAQVLAAQGHLVRLDGPRHWVDGLAAADELVVAMSGVKAYRPFVGAVNALCLVPGAERPDRGALEAFDEVFEAGDPETDAARLVAMHEALRRAFLGGLAG